MVTYRKSRKDYPRFYLNPKVEIRESPVHGAGCFAKDDINKGELLEGSPVIAFSMQSIKDLNDAIGGRHIIADYPFAWLDGLTCLVMGYGGVYNHRYEYNALYRPNRELETMDFYSSVSIKKDDEIFIRYANDRSRLWFVEEGADDIHLDPEEYRYKSELVRHPTGQIAPRTLQAGFSILSRPINKK